MSVANEVCSEIVLALVAARAQAGVDTAKLKKILMEVHSVMQQMAAAERVVGRRSRKKKIGTD